MCECGCIRLPQALPLVTVSYSKGLSSIPLDIHCHEGHVAESATTKPPQILNPPISMKVRVADGCWNMGSEGKPCVLTPLG